MYHVILLLIIGFSAFIDQKTQKWVSLFFVFGILLFSGSIYFIAMKDIFAQLVIDANGSWDPGLVMAMGDDLARLEVALLEQPLPPGTDHALENLRYPVALCADESCQSSAELEALADCYDAINIKLDKCGGVTEALKMRDWCHRYGKKVMVGNMLGSSLAMAPAVLVAQGADFVDLDGPLWQLDDVEPPLSIVRGVIAPPPAALWG